jgi:hypothetical protein
VAYLRQDALKNMAVQGDWGLYLPSKRTLLEEESPALAPRKAYASLSSVSHQSLRNSLPVYAPDELQKWLARGSTGGIMSSRVAHGQNR